MKKLILATLFIGSLASAATKIDAGKYALDAVHSKVAFEISHLVISSVDGRFTQYEGEIEMGKTINDTKISATIQSASVDTGNVDREKHLKSPDFFDAAKFPTLTFKSKKISGTADALKITGDLTLHGVTKEVALTGKYKGVVTDPYGATKIAFTANGKISRKDFGLVWSKVIEAGPVVGDEVTLSFNIEAGKAVAKTAAL